MSWQSQSSASLAAVDLGGTEVRVAVAREAGGQWQMEREFTAATAGEARSLLTAQAPRIVTAIGADEVLFQTLELPATELAELRQILELQLDQLTPWPIEEVVHDFEVLHTAAGRSRVLVVIGRTAALNERVKLLEDAGLRAERVGVDVLARFRALWSRELLPRTEGLHLFVQWAAGRAHVVAYVAGQPVAVRTIWLTEANLAEELQRTVLAAQVDGAAPVRGQLTIWAEDGESAAGAEELAREWPGGAQLLARDAIPSLAASLCWETVAPEPRVNLLPAEWRSRRRTASRRRLWIRAGLAVAALYVLLLVVVLGATGWRQARLKRLRAETAAVQPDYLKARQLQGELAAMQLQLDTKFSALDVLREVSVLMPESLKLSGYTFRRDETVTLKGQAESAPAVYDFISKLEQSELFASVKTVGVRTEGGGGLTKFELLATLKSAGSGKAGGGAWR